MSKIIIKADALICFYTGNVCSTPFIQSFNRIKDTCVPIHEHLDEYYIQENIPDEDPVDVFIRAFSSLIKKEYSGTLKALGVDVEDIGSCRDKRLIAFKWRPFLPKNRKKKNELLKYFKSLSLIPISIVRRSVVDQAIKVVINEKYYGTRWPQFNAAKMSKLEYEAYLGNQDKLSINLDNSDILYCINVAKGFHNRTKSTLSLSRELCKAKPKLVISEDIFTPLINELKFIEFCESIGISVLKLDREKSIKVNTRKAGLNLTNVSNYDDIKNAPELRRIENAYQNTLLKNAK